MAGSGHKLILSGILVLAGINPGLLCAKQLISGNIQLVCSDQLNINLVHCHYRFIEPDHAKHVSARINDINLVVSNQQYFSSSGKNIAILLLVDTSDPAREPVISRIRNDIRKLIQTENSNIKLGLARFDKGLTSINKTGSPKEAISNSLGDLHATGKITELYRSLLSAIELLKTVDADRKAIYLFSDGLAEDKAYYHDDVINAADSAGIIITSLGYPRSVSKSVALQTIRRLSEETGGLYIEANEHYQLPDSFISKPFAELQNGGDFTIDMSPLVSDKKQFIPVNIAFESTHENYNVVVKLPAPYSASVIKPEIVDAGKETSEQVKSTNPPVKIITREVATTTDSFNKLFWYGIPLVLVILLLITIIFYLSSIFREKRRGDSNHTADTFKPYAYLVLQDETKKRYSITRTTWRIGRSSDNEMPLYDSSVSRRHAEIHRDKGDLFTIYDLDSLNGVYINSNKVSKSLLHEGDIIEIGDINLRFTLLSAEFSVEESTVMQNTRAPITH